MRALTDKSTVRESTSITESLLLQILHQKVDFSPKSLLTFNYELLVDLISFTLVLIEAFIQAYYYGIKS